MIDDALVIIPAFNEESVIEETLAELHKFACKAIVVNDGSRDETAARAKKAGATVLTHAANLGYGAALKTGFTFALRYYKEPYLMAFDADGQHDPAFLQPLLDPLRAGGTDYAIGSRFLSGVSKTTPAARKIGSRVFSIATSAVIGQKITDPTSGMIALTRGVAKVFASKFFPFDYPDADVLIMLSRMGFRIREVPVVMRAARRPGSMHAGLLRPAYYIMKMGVSMVHFALRRDLKEQRKEMESEY
jgi:glycosyltransferase involved in cell wall biosynthesis